MNPKTHLKPSIRNRIKHFYVNHRLLILLYIGLLIMTIITLGFGRYPISPIDIIHVAIKKVSGNLTTDEAKLAQIIFNIRLPRIGAAILTGGCLSAAGAAMQGTFRNPMVSPSLLGVSSGSAFGAALAILLQLGNSGVQILSFTFGIATILAVYFIHALIHKEGQSTTSLILIGIVISSLFSSLISLLKYVADPYDALPAITFWLMGSLAHVSHLDVLPILFPIALGLGTLIIVRWRITILSFGEEEASSIGLNYKKNRIVVVMASTLVTASVVSISGLIGFVGLIVPHIARLLVGPNYTKMLPASIAIGGIYLLIIDTISRSLLSSEIPLGILTSIIGTPFFIFLMIHYNKN